MAFDRYDCGLSYYVPEIVFFFFKIGEAMLEPSVRLFIYQGVCMQQFANNTHICEEVHMEKEAEDQLQRLSANYIMFYKMILNVPAILLGLFCGAWSDRIGRKLPIMLSSFGTIIAVLFYMLSMVAQDNKPFLPLVFVGASIRGAFGKSAITTMALHSYVTDTTTKGERTKKLGRLLSMNFFGYFVGSLVAGALLDISSFDVVFCTVVFVNCLCVVITLAFMKESVPGVTSIVPRTPEDGPIINPDMTVQKKHKHPFTLSNIKESIEVLVQPRSLNGRCHLLVLFGTIIIQQVCKSGEVDITLLFVERRPLEWRKAMYGYLLAVDYACLGLAVLAILPSLIYLMSLHDMTLILIGIGFKILRLFILAFANQTWLVYLSVVVGCPSAMIISGVKSLITKTIREDQVGKAFSLLSCGETLSNFLGSIIFVSLYSATVHLYPGFTFALDSAVFVLLFITLMMLTKDMQERWRFRELNDMLSQDDKTDYGSTTAVGTYKPMENSVTTASLSSSPGPGTSPLTPPPSPPSPSTPLTAESQQDISKETVK